MAWRVPQIPLTHELSVCPGPLVLYDLVGQSQLWGFRWAYINKRWKTNETFLHHQHAQTTSFPISVERLSELQLKFQFSVLSISGLNLIAMHFVPNFVYRYLRVYSRGLKLIYGFLYK